MSTRQVMPRLPSTFRLAVLIGPGIWRGRAASKSKSNLPLTITRIDCSSNWTGYVHTNGRRDSQEAEIAATGLQPSDGREAALVARVAPGNYTAIVRGVGKTTEVGLVEVYNLQ